MDAQHSVNMSQMKLSGLLQKQITKLQYISVFQSVAIVLLTIVLLFH